MSSATSALSPGLQALTSALPSLSNTPASVLQSASPSSLAALAASNVQLQQVQELFGISGGADSVALSDQALSYLAGTSASAGTASTQSLLQQVQALFASPSPSATGSSVDSLNLSNPALLALNQLQVASAAHSGAG